MVEVAHPWTRRVAVGLVLVAGCIHEDLVYCDDGRVCPIGTLCDDTHATCVQPAQLTACESTADGLPCVDFTGICDRGVCGPGCGDGVRSATEDCDDGNFASHDGCSSECLVEVASWERWQNPMPWLARANHAAGYDAARGHLVVVGGVTEQGLEASAWQRTYVFFVSDRWAEIAAPASPRSDAAMAFDPGRGVLVMFGGRTTLLGAYVADTLEFDGNTWVKRTPLVSPPARAGAAMVYDPLRQRIVMFGGIATGANGDARIGDTWEYDGSTWLQITDPGPSPRSAAGIAWDDDRGRAVLFGGSNAAGNLCDTWERVGTTWTAITTSVSPSCRAAAGMAYLPARHAVVLFGGDLFFAQASDTWEYDAAGWRQVFGGPTTPPGRTGHTLTYDASEGALVLVGGTSSRFFDDIWHYLGDGSWQQMDPERGTPRAGFRSLVFDESAREPLLFGGLENTTWAFANDRWELRSEASSGGTQVGAAATAYMPELGVLEVGGLSSGGPVDEVWVWRDNAWTQLPSTTRPSPRLLASMAYSPKLGVSVLFGGATDLTGATAFGDTWEFDGTSWTERITAEHPAPQAAAAMVYDPLREQVVLVDLAGTAWSYDADGWTRIATTNALPARTFANAIYDRRRQAILLFGGSTDSREILGDVWELRDGTWTQVVDVGPRFITRALAADDDAGTFVMFGGTTGSTNDGTTWLFARRSATPDEVCTNGVDDDNDRQIDALDPDCR